MPTLNPQRTPLNITVYAKYIRKPESCRSPQAVVARSRKGKQISRSGWIQGSYSTRCLTMKMRIIES